MRPQLLFVYNADSGLFNTVADIAHKILSPSSYTCNLCALTYGHFKVREEWVSFLKTLDVDCEFLHRDEFHAKHGLLEVALPAVFRVDTDQPKLWIDACALNSCASLEDLKSILVIRIQSSFS